MTPRLQECTQGQRGIPEAAMSVPKWKSSHTLTVKLSVGSGICPNWLSAHTPVLPERFMDNVHVIVLCAASWSNL